MDRVKRIWYLSPMRAAKVQASLRIRAVSPEPSLLAHTSSESRGTLRQKARSLAQLNGWACAVEICHDGMLEDTNSLDGAHIMIKMQSSYHYLGPFSATSCQHPTLVVCCYGIHHNNGVYMGSVLWRHVFIRLCLDLIRTTVGKKYCDCFAPYLVNVATQEYRSICLQRIEQLTICFEQ